MKISSIKTHRITKKDNLFNILDRYLHDFKENWILAVTSKIVSICQNRLIKIGACDKKELVKQEADYFLPSQESKHGLILTIKSGILLPTAGIDESNGNGYYLLHPTNPQKTANKLRSYLVNRFKIKKAGVVITDSRSTPLRWGVSGVTLAHSGFKALNDYIGKPDIFGRSLKVTKVNVMDALAQAAVLVMGEGNEQTPLAVISDLPFVAFQKRNPTQKELESLQISLDEDLFAPLLKSVAWRKKDI